MQNINIERQEDSLPNGPSVRIRAPGDTECELSQTQPSHRSIKNIIPV